MYRGEQQPCPGCGAALALVAVGTTFPCAGCPGCGGMWLGPEASIHVMRGLRDEATSDVAAVSRRTARSSIHPGVPDSGARSCPVCQLVMARLAIGAIVVDSCATHGTWFDREEVGDVITECRRLRADQNPGPLVALAGKAVDATEDVLLVTQNLFELFVKALDTILAERPRR